jgi:CheY-like chemotaxis protein
MSRFLIVDDSVIDRLLVTRIVEKHYKADITYAVDGEDALRCLEYDGEIDLILTDLQMPKLDGLGLLAAVRERFPLIPVIILTGSGSEEIAVRALAEGASSYIPKLLMQQQLSMVVKTVLGASNRRHQRRELSRHLVCLDVEYRLPNDQDMLSAVVADLQDLGQHSGVVEERDRTRIGVGLEEALANAIIHGNLEVSSALRESDDGSYERAIEARRQTPPYCDRRVFVRSSFTPHEARFVITDEGPGFDKAAVRDPSDPANFLRPGGRGLVLIRSFMDQAYHNTLGNEITLIKRAQASPEPEDEDRFNSVTCSAEDAENVDFSPITSLCGHDTVRP